MTLSRLRTLALSMCALLLPLASAGEARLGVKGDVLRGHITKLDADGVTFESIYGDGSIEVPWKDIESLETDEGMVVMYGDDAEIHGRILALEDGVLLIGTEPTTAERIEVESLFGAFDEKDFDGTTLDHLRSRFRYWTATLDAAAAYTDATTDTVATSVGLVIDRRKGPTYLLFEGAARYANQKEDGEDRSLTEGIAYGFLRGEYDFAERFFGYTSNRATYDATQHLSLRLEPRGGLGVHLIKEPDYHLSTDLGVAWVYENYFGDEPVFDGVPVPEQARGTNQFWAVAFGIQADAKLPFGTLWRARGEYLPAVDDWTGDYLLRGETSIDFPLLEWLAFRVAVSDEYDNTPAEGSQRNRFTTTAGLSFRFP